MHATRPMFIDSMELALKTIEVFELVRFIHQFDLIDILSISLIFSPSVFVASKLDER